MKFLKKLFGVKRISFTEAVETTSVELFSNCYLKVRLLKDNKVFSEELGTDPEYLGNLGWMMVEEFLFFSLHLVDRVSFGILGPDRRDVFMDALFRSVLSSLSKALLKDTTPEDICLKYSMSFYERYRLRNETYGKYVFAPTEKGPSLKDTLFWEAAKVMATEISLTSKDKMAVILCGILPQCFVELGPFSKRLKTMKN